MSVSTPAIRTRAGFQEPAWLHSQHWDLAFVTLNVVLVIIPYLAYLGLLQLGVLLGPIAEQYGTTMDDLSRNIVNITIALLIGGPHMYATFTRTTFDADYRAKHPRIVWTSLAIPAVVVGLALFDLQLLLTVFFFWASVHVLHQIVYITEMYGHKAGQYVASVNQSLFGKASDYAVILTALYPLAAYKMSIGEFAIGRNDVGATVGIVLNFFGLSLGSWMIWLTGGAFALALAIWIFKTAIEYQQGLLQVPKTLFILLTVVASFFVPALGNLDTAFQGMNLWHSFQYLALTWMLNNLRRERGELDNKPLLKRLSQDDSARRYYLFNVGLTVADVMLAGVIFLILRFAMGLEFDAAFDRSYYIAILSFLWMHYYHDHFLFTEPDVIAK